MKNLCHILGTLLVLIFIYSCSDENENENTQVYANFLKDSLEVSSDSGSFITPIEFSGTTWSIEMDSDKGFITHISQEKGGNIDKGHQFNQIKFYYSGNNTLYTRKQDVFLINKATGKRSILSIIQRAKYDSLAITLDPSTKYQYVTGFGGMFMPKIWIGKDGLLNKEDIDKMCSSKGLGYNILRLMVYPNETDWASDVELARYAQQQYGVILFASPWDCTDALADKITVNGKDYKHLKHDNYGAYAEHLIRYINYMKSNGVNIYAMSIQNEPDMDFTYWEPLEIVDFIKRYGPEIRKTGVKLMAPEACGFSPDYTDPILNDADAFSNTDIFAGHLYQGFINLSSGYVSARHDYISGLYNNKLNGAGKGGWWMTEHYIDDPVIDENSMYQAYLRWNYSLNNFAKELHMCMDAYCSAYIYWYLKRHNGGCGLIGNDGTFPVDENNITKDGYILAHYAKYASNMTRIKVSVTNPNVLTTAYMNSSKTEMTIVMLNMSKNAFNGCISSPIVIKNIEGVESTMNDNMIPVTINTSKDKKQVSVLIPKISIVSVRLSL
jgi:glucuronoarabinoxylan endo-1,4-beta-xylanase